MSFNHIFWEEKVANRQTLESILRHLSTTTIFTLGLGNTSPLSRSCASEHSYRNISGVILEASPPRALSHIGAEKRRTDGKSHTWGRDPGVRVHVRSGERSRGQRSNTAKTLREKTGKRESRSKPGPFLAALKSDAAALCSEDDRDVLSGLLTSQTVHFGNLSQLLQTAS